MGENQVVSVSPLLEPCIFIFFSLEVFTESGLQHQNPPEGIHDRNQEANKGLLGCLRYEALGGVHLPALWQSCGPPMASAALPRKAVANYS